LKVLKEYIQYKEQDENISMVAEQALQQLLFEVENVPLKSFCFTIHNAKHRIETYGTR
jgi:hypothetical protein